VVKFGAERLLHFVAGTSFCRISDSFRNNIAELAAIESNDGSLSCTFASSQLENLIAEGSERG
jgi:hypothetical protein